MDEVKEKSSISTKWEKAIKRYVTYIKYEKRLSDNSVEAYLRDINKFASYIQHMFEGIGPEVVEQQMIEKFMQWLYDKESENENFLYEKSSQARILSSVRSFYNFLLVIIFNRKSTLFRKPFGLRKWIVHFVSVIIRMSCD